MEWKEGDRVRVVRGPFEGFLGTVAGHQDGVVTVDVEIFERSTPVLLPPEDLEPGDDYGGGPGGVREPRRPSSPPSSERTVRALDD
jgi:hypothetical protein